MSAKGRPERECRSAQREGTPMSATRALAGRSEGPRGAPPSTGDGRPTFDESARQCEGCGEVKGGIA